MSDPNLNTFLLALPFPGLMIGPDNRISACNPMADTLIGTGSVGRHYVSALRQPALIDTIDDVFANGTGKVTRFMGRDPLRDAVYKVTVNPIGTSVLLVFEDQTEIEQAGQMRRDFVANVSHELRTPLTALLGFIETLRGPARNDAAARDRFLSIMEGEAARMSQLVSDLLSLSRVEENERRRPTDPVDLVALIDNAVSVLGPVAATAGVSIQRKLPDHPVTVPGDADQLRQVIRNLVENAIKYGVSGGRVVISLSDPGPQPLLRLPGVVLSVQDFGEGFAAHHIPRLTERFYRIDRHRSREVGGTGLGLAIVKHIVGRHRGRLHVESEPGKGSRFSVVLPTAN